MMRSSKKKVPLWKQGKPVDKKKESKKKKKKKEEPKDTESSKERFNDKSS